MSPMFRPLRGGLAAAALAMSCAGCVPMTGTASLTLMTRDAPAKVNFQAVGGRVARRECFYWAGVFGVWGNAQQTHESAVERLLEEHDADVLMDAQFYNESYGIPYIFMMSCATVEGQPAKVVAR